MGSRREHGSSAVTERVSTSAVAGHPSRPKHLHPRLESLRVDGRRIAAELFARTLRDEEESMRHIARVLGCSAELVKRWCDPDDKRQLPVGDLVGLAIAGSTTIVYAYLDELVRFLHARMTTGRSGVESAAELAKATGLAATALTEVQDRATRIRAVRVLKMRCDEVLADIDAEGAR